ncbi:MAG: NAD(P)H-dependent oxidoreductase [Chitinispirillaceae bacterium]|jgi:chromate reductase|nr:NAD(P)H-dependent oxidoreductase [Chitinispirillaceae bacterium]
MTTIKILGFAGSLRKNSYNKAILRAAKDLLPENAGLEIFDLAGIPPYNQDLEMQLPETVTAFKAKIKAADAILIATPEYNYSVPGVLKNALDWGSRPYGENSFNDKPLAIIGASIGQGGSSRAQYHLRQSCVALNMHPLNKPEVMLANAQDKINSNNILTDDYIKDLIRMLLNNLVIQATRLKRQ